MSFIRKLEISKMERVEINYCPMCGRKLNENGK